MEFDFAAGSLPILVSMPHAGSALPATLAARLTASARASTDSDWHLPRLYDFLGAMGASTLAARQSRYVIDVNRPPEDTNLYPGMDTTGLCPLDSFAREPLYLPGLAPDAAEVAQRLTLYWQPYHQQLQAELDRLLAQHGAVVLWEAHSIASRVPRFFDGRLPDFNIGTFDGAACGGGLAEALLAPVPPAFSTALNGRFKGGYITRRYGRPQQGVHAIQLEMCQCLYMNEPDMDPLLLQGADATPLAYRPDLAAAIRPLLQAMVGAAVDWVRQ
ncbi:N-formylglutamate deformylase [Massilia sp. PWRC2]|uniref:N-formylglutamate deformylase n=1 Tax=Massilia sp. PWRC2 TaxID=2804626 RepID=UPI003CF91B7E